MQRMYYNEIPVVNRFLNEFRQLQKTVSEEKGENIVSAKTACFTPSCPGEVHRKSLFRQMNLLE